LWCATFFFALVAGSAVVVCDVVELVVTAAADVDVVLGVDEPPQPATATATAAAIVASTVRFIVPALMCRTFRASGYKTLRPPVRFGK
jgi:hypothetical protein